MRTVWALSVALFIAVCAVAIADGGNRNRKVAVPDFWVTDLDEAFTRARGEGKLLFVVFRCDP
jgi:hypothetical protein